MATTEVGPAYRVETERLVIRCWQPQDAALAKEAIDASREYLREWMPWADTEPEPLAVIIKRLRQFRKALDDTFSENLALVVDAVVPHQRTCVNQSVETFLLHEPSRGEKADGWWIRTDDGGALLTVRRNAQLLESPDVGTIGDS